MGIMEVGLGTGGKVFQDKWKNENLRWEMILFKQVEPSLAKFYPKLMKVPKLANLN